MARLGWLFLLMLVHISAMDSKVAVDGLTPEGELDRKRISDLYYNGDFGELISALETYRKRRPNTTRDDSVYVFKYLSVVYAADPSTQVRAESYMYNLVRMVPTIELVDMYVSDQIQMIFRDVKERFRNETAYLERYDNLGKPLDVDDPTQHISHDHDNGSEPRGNTKSNGNQGTGTRRSYWVLGSIGGALVVGTAAYFLFSPEEKPGRSFSTGD